MKITIPVMLDADYVRSVIAGCHSRYWASDLEFHRASPDLGFTVTEHNDSRDPTKHTVHVVNHERVIRGLAALARTSTATHFAAMLGNNDDGVTGDCLVQMCTFGELKYG